MCSFTSTHRRLWRTPKISPSIARASSCNARRVVCSPRPTHRTGPCPSLHDGTSRSPTHSTLEPNGLSETLRRRPKHSTTRTATARTPTRWRRLEQPAGDRTRRGARRRRSPRWVEQRASGSLDSPLGGLQPRPMSVHLEVLAHTPSTSRPVADVAMSRLVQRHAQTGGPDRTELGRSAQHRAEILARDFHRDGLRHRDELIKAIDAPKQPLGDDLLIVDATDFATLSRTLVVAAELQHARSWTISAARG